jgi:hypothetical protein
MPCWYRIFKSPHKREAEPKPQGLGPAQRQLSDQTGIKDWHIDVDWATLEAQEAALERKLAAVTKAAQTQRAATAEGSQHCQAKGKVGEQAGIIQRLVSFQHQQRK